MPAIAEARRVRNGFIAVISAYGLWGVSPLFFKALSAVDPFEVVAHRVVWSLLAVALVVLVSGRAAEAWAVLKKPRSLMVFAGSAVAITINWVTFVYAVGNGKALQASLGYYVFPLVTVVLAAVFLKETFSRRQGVALLMVIGGVGALVAGLGSVPWVTLTLALSFAIYGLLRKIAPAESLVGLFVETLLLLPPAVLWLVWRHMEGLGVTAAADWNMVAVLAIGTPLWTALPLFLFTLGARRLRLSVVGLMQYMNPTMQFLIATFVFNETFTTAHAIAFGLIWSGLVVYLWPRRRRPGLTTPAQK